MFIAFLGIGGNLGNRLDNLKKSITCIEEQIGNVFVKSSVYETKAWGKENQPDFLNMAIGLNTALNATEILNEIKKIETLLGRKRVDHWGTRTIDIDILFWGDEIIQTKDLNIPHPFIQERMFVLEPLNEISPELIHPVLKKSVNKLYQECNDKLEVVKLNEKI